MRSDEELLEAWRGGDREAGEQLFDRYFAPLQRFFRNKLHDAGEVDDLVQRTFLACVGAKDRFRGDASVRAYVFGVAYNTLRMHLRGRRRKLEPIDFGTVSVIDLGASPSALLGWLEEEHLLLAALRGLPLELQVVLELRYWESLSSAEISRVIEVPAATVRSRLRRARAQLERQIAALASTPALALRTTQNLEAWAARVRAQL